MNRETTLFPPILEKARQLVVSCIDEGSKVVDATVGNGHDTLFLANLVGSKGIVYGFDIQQIALERTKARLQEAGLQDRVQLFHVGHEQMAQYVPKDLQVVMFNLGYLPRADKSITTEGPTTVMAIKAALSRLKKGGLLLLVVYWGHDSGKVEREMVEEYVATLPQQEYTVLRYEYINQVHSPPYLIAIEKRGES